MLTNREKQVLGWSAQGKSAQDVGAILSISNRTVEWHLTNIRQKLSAENLVHAIALAIRAGIIVVAGEAGVGISSAFENGVISQHLFSIIFGVIA